MNPIINLNFFPFPVLETSRLRLRQLEKSDVVEVLKMRSNPKTMQFIPRPLLKNTEEALAHIKMIEDCISNSVAINWAICLKDDPKMIGIIGHYRIQPENFRAEVGYILMEDFHNLGFATEAVKEVLKFGFEIMNLHSIEAVIDPENVASEKVLLKNGFVKEGHFLENEFFDGRFLDAKIYSLLKRNFKS